MRLSTNFRSVFFDLDGTLADTAPDLAAAANQMRIDRHLHPIDPQILRPLASAGARGLIEASFGIKPDDDSFADLRDEFLNNYQAAIHVHTRLFDDIENLLNLLDQANIPWGIVTNKQKRFTNPLMQSMGLDQRTRAIVSGDTTPFAKPHPAPILLAAKILEIDPKHSLYVGDDLRDIVAGKAAGMQTVAAAYGYCGNHEPPDSWGADHLAYHPTDLIDIIFPKNRLE